MGTYLLAIMGVHWASLGVIGVSLIRGLDDQ